MECFVEGEEEVAHDNELEDAIAMEFIAWCIWERAGIAGANGEAIVDALDEGCGIL